MKKVYVLLKEGEIEGIYSDKLTAQSVKNFYLLGPYQGYLKIQEHNFYGKPTETNIIREVE